jgi:hypothetical protein
MHNVTCRYQASYRRTWYWSRPISRAAGGKRSSTRYRAAVTSRTVRSAVPAGIPYRYSRRSPAERSSAGTPVMSTSVPGATRSDGGPAARRRVPEEHANLDVLAAPRGLAVPPVYPHGTVTPLREARLHRHEYAIPGIGEPFQHPACSPRPIGMSRCIPLGSFSPAYRASVQLFFRASPDRMPRTNNCALVIIR